MQQTSSASNRRDSCGGFTLVEAALALAIVGLIATIAYPRTSSDPGATELRITSLKIASLLRQDRNMAVRFRRPVSTQVDAQRGTVRAGLNGRDVQVASGIGLVLSKHGRSGTPTIDFRPNGETAGGRIVLASRTSSYLIEIGSMSGAVTVSAGAGDR